MIIGNKNTRKLLRMASHMAGFVVDDHIGYQIKYL